MTMSKKERTLQEILRAAKASILADGHESVTVRRLAEKTGLAYTGLYYYFKDLNALLWTLRLDMIDDMMAELTVVESAHKDPIEALLAGLSQYTGYFFQHPTVFRFFYFGQFVQPEGDERYLKLQARMGEIWQQSFSRLVQSGQVLPEEIDFLARTIIYALQGMITLSFSANGLMTQETVQSELEQLVLYLLKKEPQSPEGGQ
ncbi:MAG: TetR/AcrR family transcriptional regulator [Clostridia bacterium]|nr:TetR/AcrR family transcriptional regulator [Clostridia bacterium]